MKFADRFLILKILTLVFCFSFPLHADLISDLKKLKPTSYVFDQAKILDNHAKQSLEALLSECEKKTSAEIAVVTVSSLENSDINTAANDLFQSWGIGKKGKDNGVLFLVAPNERKMRVEVGYGLESILPDGRVGRLLDENAIPYFKAGDYSGGIQAGSYALISIIAESQGVKIEGIGQLSKAVAPTRPLTFLEKFLMAVFFFFVLVVIIRNPFLLLFLLSSGRRGSSGGNWSDGNFGGGGFGGFGGGSSGGGGASRGW